MVSMETGFSKEVLAESNLVGNGATVDLDLHKMGLLLLEGRLADLGVGENTDDGAVLLDALEFAGDGGTAALGVLLGVLGEGLLLALVPVLVESALDFVAQVLSPHGGEGAETTGSLNITNKTNNDHLEKTQMLAIGTKPSGLHCSYWWCIDDRDGLNNFLLVRLCARSVEVTNDRGHTGLVAHGSRQVDGLLGVILGEAIGIGEVVSH